MSDKGACNHVQIGILSKSGRLHRAVVRGLAGGIAGWNPSQIGFAFLAHSFARLEFSRVLSPNSLVSVRGCGISLPGTVAPSNSRLTLTRWAFSNLRGS